MKKKLIIIITIILLTIVSIITVFKKDTSIVEKSKINKIERKEFNIYLQKTVGSKDYDPSTDTTFPTSGYLLNTTKTMCYGYNGNKLNSNPVTQELTDGVINGSITINSNNTIYCDLYFDKNETPTISKFDITGKTSNNQNLTNGFTYQTDNIPFTVTYTDNESDVKQYCINETNSTANCNWQTLSGTEGTYTLIDKNDGEKTMYIYLKDKANNVSVITDKSTAKITVDQTKPKITSFTLTGTADTNQTLSDSAQYTHKVGITYDATIEESNIDSYCVYEDSCSYTSLTSTTLTNQNYTLNDTEGEHTLTIKVKDKAGNESDIETKSITLDTSNPTATIASNTKDTSSITVTVSGTDTTPGSSIIERQCRKSGGSWVNANTNGSCTINSLDNGTKLTDGTEYTIEGRVRDASGRWNTNYPSVNVKIESTGFSGTGMDLLDYSPRGLVETESVAAWDRFVGEEGDVDNYVCFGWKTKSDCENDEYIYRIISLYPVGQLKLIKDQPLQDYYPWHNDSSSCVSWEQSDLFESINGSAFYDKLDPVWQKQIDDVTWYGGSVSEAYEDAYLVEEEELSNPIEGRKIGLMTVSDVLWSCGESGEYCHWDSENWLTYRWWDAASSAQGEWTMTESECNITHGSGVWAVPDPAAFTYGWAYETDFETRPVFVLHSSSFISSGSGTSSDPFIIDLCDGNPSCNRNPGGSGAVD